ncbi:protease Do-like 8, chloroplastic [Cryptomeria japonica]|uniref:protease Do-like 8, chloroplastic n=1 Tax=Cryptomeria japonica TaxID=3369 RepID=UPI0027DA290E|nr:protease Do-like 8, chloroplastic [Cryptomeria japonica]
MCQSRKFNKDKVQSHPKVEPPHFETPLIGQGNSAMSSKRYYEAIDLYTLAISLSGDNAVYYCNRAAAHTQVGKYIEAIEDCNKSIQLDPCYSKAYSRLGLVYYAQGKYHDAIQKGFEKALELKTHNTSVKENIRTANDYNTRDFKTAKDTHIPSTVVLLSGPLRLQAPAPVFDRVPGGVSSMYRREMGLRRLFVQTDIGNVLGIEVDRDDKVQTIKKKLFLLSGQREIENEAYALGDPTVTIEEVTPPVSPTGKLYPSEERTVELFERNTYSVVNIFDVTLRPQLNMTGMVEVPEGNGSGIVWDEQGHIVTNYHVIGNALSKNPSRNQVVARVNILASDGVQKSFEGTLVGADRTKDLAVLKIDAPNEILRPVEVGKSSTLKVGQRCLAIGNPFGFDHTLTTGVLSGLNQEIFSKAGVTIRGGIQTDAAINPRNSGGPLLNSKGKVIGINTAIFTQTGTSAGVGFAIPSDIVLKIIPQLIQSGKVVRPGLNIEIAPDAIANQLNVRTGALVLSVPGESAAANSGLIPTKRGFAGKIILGDVIIGVENSPIKNATELSKVLEDYSVGNMVMQYVKCKKNKHNTKLSWQTCTKCGSI